MIESLKRIFGLGPSVDYGQLLKQGAIVLDVRSNGEFSTGHIQGSVNISVDQLINKLHKLPNKEKPIITCCASGMRSSVARRILKSHGYTNVHNAGSWLSLQRKI